MYISNHDEILVKYASTLEQFQLQKVAWDWTDLANNLGLSALTGAGVGAIAGGTAGAVEGAVGLTPALIGAAKALLAGGGLPASAIVGSVGISAILPLVLVAGGVAWSIYEVTKLTDDNIDDLMDRLEDLDPNSKAEGMINEWRTVLESFKPYFQITQAPDPNNPEEVSQDVMLKMQNLNKVAIYLNKMKQTWPSVKSNLTDWGRDDEQFEVALFKTSDAVSKQLQQIKQQSQSAAIKLLPLIKKQMGVDYSAIAKQVVDIHNQISQLEGVPPEYEEYERPAFELAQNILTNQAEVQDIKEFGPQMKSLLEGRNGLISALQRAQKRHRSKKVSFTISKRAVRLSGESVPAAGAGPRTDRSPGGQATTVAKDPAVQALQKSINYLNLNLKTGIGRIAEDGVYGPNTANALVSILEKAPKLEEYLIRVVGIDRQSISDIKFMKANPEYFNGLVQTINSVVNQMRNPSGKTQQRQEYDSGVQCRMDKENPKPAEIIACLRTRQIKNPRTGEYMNAYEYLITKGLRDNDMVALINQLFGGARSEDWSMPVLENHFSSRSRYNAFGVY